MREKLIELLANDDCPMFMVFGDSMDGLVDYLITNGVTFATDNNVGSKWIPVSERLPEDRQRVLCWCGCGRIYHGFLHFANCLEDISYDFEGEKSSGFWDYNSEWGHYEVTDITHWMPLPEPPKEGE